MGPGTWRLSPVPWRAEKEGGHFSSLLVVGLGPSGRVAPLGLIWGTLPCPCCIPTEHPLSTQQRKTVNTPLIVCPPCAYVPAAVLLAVSSLLPFLLLAWEGLLSTCLWRCLSSRLGPTQAHTASRPSARTGMPIFLVGLPAATYVLGMNSRK